MMVLAIINSVNKATSFVFDENAIINQENMEITLMHTKVIFLPIFSKKYPDSRPPIGLEIAVTDANHDACPVDNLISLLCSFNSGSVVAG
jgi:hypothetical protein